MRLRTCGFDRRSLRINLDGPIEVVVLIQSWGLEMHVQPEPLCQVRNEVVSGLVFHGISTGINGRIDQKRKPFLRKMQPGLDVLDGLFAHITHCLIRMKLKDISPTDLATMDPPMRPVVARNVVLSV